MPRCGHDKRAGCDFREGDGQARRRPADVGATTHSFSLSRGCTFSDGVLGQVVQQAQVEVAVVEPLLEVAGVGGQHPEFDPRVILQDRRYQ